MAEKLTFVGLEVLSFTRTKSATKASVSCELSAPVLEKMEWEEAPECYTGGGLEGDVAAISAELLPSDRSLSRHAFELDAVRLNAFKTVRLEIKGKKGVGHRTELRFTITSGDLKAARKLEEYFLIPGKSQLRVSYEKAKPAAEQTQMGMDTGCPSCDDEIALQPDNPKKHVNGSKCTARPTEQGELPTN
jgi:hypothetical protein